MNERVTENLVRDQLQNLGYYDESSATIVEEQKSQIAQITKALRGASKTGKGGKGSPEFIVTSPDTPDFVIVVECKADVKLHESEARENPATYAVDGVLHYSHHLATAYNVISVAASGQTKKGMKVSVFLQAKGSLGSRKLTTKQGKEVSQILSWDDLVSYGTYDPEVTRKRMSDLLDFSRDLHEFMRDHAKLTESEKPLLVSGTLIALRNKPFAKSFGEYPAKELQSQWMRVIKEEMKKAEIPNSKEYSMTQPYTSIAVHPELGKPTRNYPQGVLHELIRLLREHVWPFISIYQDYDVVGQFYGEFLKYTGGDKKALGIVLTPKHITELFARVANIKPNDKVLDLCAGTGAFLISAMHYMFERTQSESEQERIRKDALIGVEQQPNMYALAASNMILRGDGKANLYQGSCFDSGIETAARSHQCSVGMLNPPYSQSDEDLHELVFVRQMLDCLVSGGIGIAIIPMSCVISPHPMKAELLKSHTLDAVMSMPDDLFYPVGVVTCIVVFRAHVPHEDSDQKTWFGYWKADGFSKTKHRGRIDLERLWPEKRDQWVSSYRNRDDIAGSSVKKHVSPGDEWCAEAYMETDYSRISANDYRSTVAKHLMFLFQNDADEAQ